MPKFLRSNIQKLGNQLSRDIVVRQQLKICFSCKKGFCRRKGRAKVQNEILNAPGQFICESCVNKFFNGEKIKHVSVFTSL